MTATINGTTGIDLHKDGSVLQADLAPNVAGNGPCFSVYQSVSQSTAQNVSTKLIFDAKEFDTTLAFDAVTNSRFQPSVAGYYHLSGAVYFNNATSIWVAIFKNGVEYKRGIEATAKNSTVASLVFLNGSTDYIECWALQGGTTQSTVISVVGTYFQGYLARSA